MARLCGSSRIINVKDDGGTGTRGGSMASVQPPLWGSAPWRAAGQPGPAALHQEGAVGAGLGSAGGVAGR